ncbi:dimethylallyl tryptophan synthase GliD1 [Podospora didyma]|uniref:Dimethylallyl tryptophan synthase GliD1 n=1 Tax=Podospora didyma TaxID=330526 RepID=A0AAE0N4L3_9PEZI|nr:dimethylallyl tryptophan synthase GliD1 [Podospora didyma]
MATTNGHGTNGVTTKKATASSPGTTTAWRTLTQYLPSRDPDTDFWWKYSGLHLAILLEEAHYLPEKQVEALVFFYHWGAPYMGPAPRADGKALKWKSLVQPDGTPIEYSWKWPQAESGSIEVRYDFEPIGPHAGSQLDPLCQLAAKELMNLLASSIPDSKVDNTWFHHFMSTLFEHDNTKLAAAAARGEPMSSTVLMAAEFLPKGVAFKTYIQPRLLGYPGVTPIDVYEKSIAAIEASTPARASVHEFLSTSAEGKAMAPFSVGVDNRAGSRLKWYFNSPHTSFASVREILTLNGKVQTPHIEGQLRALDELIKAVLGLPDDFPEDQHPAEFLVAKSPYNFPAPPPSADVDAPTPSPVLPGYPYYFDVAPGQPLAGVKWSLPVRNYNRDDLAVAKAFTGWMEKQGRGGDHAKRYLSMLERLAALKGVRLEDSKGLQEFISIMLKPNGEIDVTTYFSAQAFNEVADRQVGESK